MSRVTYKNFIVDVVIGETEGKAKVMYFHNEPGMGMYSAPSDLDYYGYTEVEFEMLDMNGNYSKELNETIENNEVIYEEVREQIIDYILGE